MGYGWAEASEAAHGESDQGLWGMEAEGNACDEADLGVEGLDASIGEVMAEAVLDALAVRTDLAGEFDEGDEAIHESRSTRA